MEVFLFFHIVSRTEEMAEASKGYVSLFDLGESKDDGEFDYTSLYMHHYRVRTLYIMYKL